MSFISYNFVLRFIVEALKLLHAAQTTEWIQPEEHHSVRYEYTGEHEHGNYHEAPSHYNEHHKLPVYPPLNMDIQMHKPNAYSTDWMFENSEQRILHKSDVADYDYRHYTTVPFPDKRIAGVKLFKFKFYIQIRFILFVYIVFVPLCIRQKQCHQ